MEEIYQYLRQEDFAGDIRYVYESFGMETAKKLIEECGGTTLYVPMFGSQRLRMPFIRYLAKHYDEMLNNKSKQMTFRAKYRISEGTLKNWMSEAKTKIETGHTG
jgi:hypothetical protein